VLGFDGKEARDLVIPCDGLANCRNTLLLRSVRWYILQIYLKGPATDREHSARHQSKQGVLWDRRKGEARCPAAAGRISGLRPCRLSNNP
jgi:hypothetical protein